MPENTQRTLLISIITINFNRLEDLRKTFVSVTSQTYANTEYIVIDGGSQDGSRNFLQENDDKITYWVSEPDNGIYDAMNKGAAAATGDWIIFMNAGDTFFAEDTLAQAANYLDPDIDVVYGGVQTILSDRYQTRIYYQEARDISILWKEMPACHQSIFVKKELQVKYAFDASMKWCADHNLLVRLYVDGCRFKSIPIIVSKFDASSGETKNILNYTKELWGNSKYLAGPLKRHPYFLKQYLSFFLWQNVIRKIRDILPPDWITVLRKIRSTYSLY